MAHELDWEKSPSLERAWLLPQQDDLGIDALKEVTQCCPSKKKYNLRFLLLDIDDLDFSEQFYIVFSNATIHRVSSHNKLLQNASSALRPICRVRFNFAGD